MLWSAVRGKMLDLFIYSCSSISVVIDNTRSKTRASSGRLVSVLPRRDYAIQYPKPI